MASGGYSSGPCNGVGVLTSGCKGAQGGMRVVRGGGWRAEHTKSGEKKMKVTYLNTQKRNLLIVLCMGRRFVGVV